MRFSRQALATTAVGTVVAAGMLGVVVDLVHQGAAMSAVPAPRPVTTPAQQPSLAPPTTSPSPGALSGAGSAVGGFLDSFTLSAIPVPSVPASETSPVSAAKGTAGASAPRIVPVPTVLADAYAKAAKRMPPACRMPVSLLAAIGQVESGSLAGHSITTTFRVQPAVFGPQLNGKGFAAIRDTDGGRLDGDPVWDRAVGPMQFIPGTWSAYGVDGDGDGRADPQNVYDAAASAARYLCAGGRDLATEPGLRAAILSYNYSTAYLATVLGWKARFETGLPLKNLPLVTASASPSPGVSPSPTPSKRTPTPRPTPTPTRVTSPTPFPTTRPPTTPPPTTRPPTTPPPTTPPPTTPPPTTPPPTTPPPTTPPPTTASPTTPPTTPPPSTPPASTAPPTTPPASTPPPTTAAASSSPPSTPPASPTTSATPASRGPGPLAGVAATLHPGTLDAGGGLTWAS